MNREDQATSVAPLTNREAWLAALMQKLLPLIEDAGGSIANAGTWRVSCGFPKGSSSRAIGQCWGETCSEDGRTEMFISPTLGTASDVDHVLLHEMVHASVGVKEGHKGQFAKVARKLGLTGKLTATIAGPELRERVNAITATLPEYPHAKMTLSSQLKKQSTRMLKIKCEDCGFVARTTAKWLADVGLPICACGGSFHS